MRGKWVFTSRFRLPLSIAAALLVGTPVLATIWTRATTVVRVSRGVKTPLANVAYSTREWTTTISEFEVQEGPTTGETVSPRWLFTYRNTDSEVHYVAISVQCQDVQRRERFRFSYIAPLRPNVKDGAILEVVSKARTDDWRATSYARITIDFLSSPAG